MRPLRVMCGALVLLFLCSVSRVSAADELDKKQAGALKRLDTQITNFETAFARFEASPQNFSQRLDDEYKGRIAALDAKLAELPADNEEVKAVLAHMAAFKTKQGAVSARLAGAQQAKNDENAAITALVEAPEAVDDLATLKNFGEMFGSAGRYEFGHYLYGRWPHYDMIAEMESWSAGWAGTKQKMAALTEKYGKAMEYRGHLEGKASRMHTDLLIALREAREHFPTFEKNVTAFIAGAPAQIDKHATELKAAAETAVAKQDFKAFTTWESDVSQARYQVANIARIYAPFVSAEERTKLTARVAAIEEQTEAIAQKLAEAIIRENRAPANPYAKDDRKAIESLVRAEWAKRFPSESILAIRMPSEAMERSTSWVYEPSANAFRKNDRSAMIVWVIVKDGAKQACMWPVAVYRLHLRGDTLALGESVRPSKGAPPNQRMLLANLK